MLYIEQSEFNIFIYLFCNLKIFNFKYFRMPIIDKFKDMGTVVMGKVESGSIREGNNLLIMPNKVFSIYLCINYIIAIA